MNSCLLPFPGHCLSLQQSFLPGSEAGGEGSGLSQARDTAAKLLVIRKSWLYIMHTFVSYEHYRERGARKLKRPTCMRTYMLARAEGWL